MCTSITIKSKDGNSIVGRSMENAVLMQSKVFFRPKGYQYVQDRIAVAQKLGLEAATALEAIDEKQLLRWEGKYAFVGMSALQQDFATNGMNSEGLVTGDMTLTGSEYEDGSSAPEGTVLWYLYVTNFILSTCATCQEVVEKLSALTVTNPLKSFMKSEPSLIGFLVHFPVNDAQGNALVIEYINGKLTWHDNTELGVLTNDPEFSWQQTNLKNYGNITPYNQPKRTGNRFSVISPSQGTGFLGLPGSSTPPDRFVRAAMMTNYAFEAQDTTAAVNLAIHVLNTVDIPWGTSREKEGDVAKNGVADFTEWITVSDTRNLNYYIRMYDSPSVFRIDFKKILAMYSETSEALATLKIEVPTNTLAIDLTPVDELISVS